MSTPCPNSTIPANCRAVILTSDSKDAVFIINLNASLSATVGSFKKMPSNGFYHLYFDNTSTDIPSYRLIPCDGNSEYRTFKIKDGEILNGSVQLVSYMLNLPA